MSGFNQNLLTESVGVILRDYTHASKTFRTNSYQNAPKFKFLFHTYFKLNDGVVDTNAVGRQGSGLSTTTNFGLLVKEVKLPSFTFGNFQMNQYNRKRIIQTKIKYEPIEITFHDDNGDNVNGLWQSYYTYYYNDSTLTGSVLTGTQGGPNNSGGTKQYNDRNIYGEFGNQDENHWGFSGGQSQSTGKKIPFFKNITVFGFNQHNYTAYTLVNPIITSFSHDSYNYAEGGGTMQDRMSIDYETVVYNYGNMDGKSPGNIVTGFGDQATYDTTPSPIMQPGGNQYALGQGGLTPANGGSISSPTKGNPDAAAYAQNATNANPYTASGGTNNVNSTAGAQMTALLRQSQQQQTSSRNNPFYFATAAASPGPAGIANAPTIDVISVPPPITQDVVVSGTPPADLVIAPDSPTTVDYSAFTTAGQPTVSVPDPGSTTLPPTDLITPFSGSQYAANDLTSPPDFNVGSQNI